MFSYSKFVTTQQHRLRQDVQDYYHSCYLQFLLLLSLGFMLVFSEFQRVTFKKLVPQICFLKKLYKSVNTIFSVKAPFVLLFFSIMQIIGSKFEFFYQRRDVFMTTKNNLTALQLQTLVSLWACWLQNTTQSLILSRRDSKFWWKWTQLVLLKLILKRYYGHPESFLEFLVVFSVNCWNFFIMQRLQ